MTDRELLEAAAKAAGMRLSSHQGSDEQMKKSGLWMARGYANPITGSRDWNPLADDGDALRLAVQLQISIDPRDESVCAMSKDNKVCIIESGKFGLLQAATRRAIVRAAAAMAEGTAQ